MGYSVTDREPRDLVRAQSRERSSIGSSNDKSWLIVAKGLAGAMSRVKQKSLHDINAEILHALLGARKSPNGRLARENFRDWFKNSAAVNTDGTPALMYHGSGSDLGDVIRPGTYFTNKPHIADIYAKAPTRQTDFAGPNLTAVYLSLQRPYIFNASQVNENLSHHILGKRGNTEQVMRHLLNQDFDSLIIKDYDDLGGLQDQFVIFHSSQAKSAIGNNGLFCSESDFSCDAQRKRQQPGGT